VLGFCLSKHPIPDSHPSTVTSNTEEHRQQSFVSTASSHAQKDMLVSMITLLLGLNSRLCMHSILEYPFSGVGRVAIDREHLKCLQLGRCLDDNLIEFGLKYFRSSHLDTLHVLTYACKTLAG